MTYKSQNQQIPIYILSNSEFEKSTVHWHDFYDANIIYPFIFEDNSEYIYDSINYHRKM